MICADFLAGAHLDGGGNPEILLQSLSRYYQFLPRTTTRDVSGDDRVDS